MNLFLLAVWLNDTNLTRTCRQNFPYNDSTGPSIWVLAGLREPGRCGTLRLGCPVSGTAQLLGGFQGHGACPFSSEWEGFLHLF